MPKETLSQAEAETWEEIANLLQKASGAIDLAHQKLLLDLCVTGKPLERIVAAQEATAGLAYLFMPQPEWTGDTSFVIRPPHIAR